jgi:hypothetical protein
MVMMSADARSTLVTGTNAPRNVWQRMMPRQRAEAALVGVGADDAEVVAGVRPGDDEHHHAHAPNRVLRRVVRVDGDGEEERLLAAGRRCQGVAAREPRMHVRAYARA